MASYPVRQKWISKISRWFVWFRPSVRQLTLLPYSLSNLSRHTGYSDGFRGLPQYLQTNTGILPQLRSCILPSTSLPIHTSLIILLFGVVQAELLTASLNNYLTPWRCVILEKLSVAHLLRISQLFIKPENSMPSSQELSTDPYLEPNQPSIWHPILCLWHSF
jgi:hypothetical protein